jgi:hypothetical protein
MAAGYLDLYIDQGSDFSAEFSLDDTFSASYDLSGKTVKSEIRKSYWSANTTSTFSANANTQTGIITITMPAAVSQNISIGRYVYDIFLTNQNSNTRTKILEGMLFIDPSSTRI